MQPIVFGEISCKNVPPTFGLKKHVESSMQTWASTTEEAFPANLFYEVQFEPTAQIYGKKEFVACQLKITGRHQMWLGAGVGKNTREAYARAMADLTKIYECLEYASGGENAAAKEPIRAIS